MTCLSDVKATSVGADSIVSTITEATECSASDSSDYENENNERDLLQRKEKCSYSTAASTTVAGGKESSKLNKGDVWKRMKHRHPLPRSETSISVSSTTSADVTACSSNSSSRFLWTLGCIIGGMIGGTVILLWSLWFPFFMAPKAATDTYHWAYYHYDKDLSHFDNTIWTYGTDYFLAIIMGYLAWSILSLTSSRSSSSASSYTTDRLCYYSASIPLIYCISVIAGGVGHHFYLTLESRNTWSFRLLWTICVGTVSAASCSMGMASTELIRQFQKRGQVQQQSRATTSTTSESYSLLLRVPQVPESFWIAFGLTITAAVIYGGVSFQRPACDIFIAGTTQTPSSVFMMMFYIFVPSSTRPRRVTLVSKIMGFVGFIGNAPLLPAYPLLVQYTNLSLAAVNTILHTNLCLSWSMQGLSMRHMIKSLQTMEDEEDHEEHLLQQQQQPQQEINNKDKPKSQ